MASFCRYERTNYPMMVDPNVHFHAIPRYSAPRAWNGVEFPDAGWPELPQLGKMVALTSEQIAELTRQLSSILR
jgi:diadenosine tetraphosphate (Ap4A) HIT family hydrolase